MPNPSSAIFICIMGIVSMLALGGSLIGGIYLWQQYRNGQR